jgi:hypothetical protein
MYGKVTSAWSVIYYYLEKRGMREVYFPFDLIFIMLLLVTGGKIFLIFSLSKRREMRFEVVKCPNVELAQKKPLCTEKTECSGVQT